MKLTTHLHLVPMSKNAWSYTSTPPIHLYGVVLSLKKHRDTFYHAMKTYSGLDVGARWKWVVSFTPQQFYPMERAPGTHWLGGWVGPRDGLDTAEKRKIPCFTSLLITGAPLSHHRHVQILTDTSRVIIITEAPSSHVTDTDSTFPSWITRSEVHYTRISQAYIDSNKYL
jgi:hypothetical protein